MTRDAVTPRALAEHVARELQGLPLLVDRDPQSRVVTVALDKTHDGVLHVSWVLHGVTREYDVSLGDSLDEDPGFLVDLIRWEIIEGVETGEMT